MGGTGGGKAHQHLPATRDAARMDRGLSAEANGRSVALCGQRGGRNEQQRLRAGQAGGGGASTVMVILLHSARRVDRSDPLKPDSSYWYLGPS